MNKFKVGDKIYVPEVGNWGVVIKVVAGVYCYLIKDKFGVRGYVKESEIEKFIAPKYKVGDKVIVEDQFLKPVTMEIVASKLNKKHQVYVNLLYSLKNGNYIALDDKRLFREMDLVNKKYGKKKMTLKEVENKLGYKIEIIK